MKYKKTYFLFFPKNFYLSFEITSLVMRYLYSNREDITFNSTFSNQSVRNVAEKGILCKLLKIIL